MRELRIPKRNGTFRTVCVPTPREMRALRKLLPELNLLQLEYCSQAVHGFMPGRSAVTNAAAHRGYDHTICFDLKDFFDTVTREKASAGCARLSDPEFDICFVGGIARQGLPTSPAIANLAAVHLDAEITSRLHLLPLSFRYTRYADDLTISFSDAPNPDTMYRTIENMVRASVERQGFVLAEHKTCSYSAKAGNRVITGVAVNDGVMPTRKTKRRLRAALHQGNESSARGLQEWSLLKQPTPILDHVGRILYALGIPTTPEMTAADYSVWDNIITSSRLDAAELGTAALFTRPFAKLTAHAACRGYFGELRRSKYHKNVAPALVNWALSPNTMFVGLYSRRGGAQPSYTAGAMVVRTENGTMYYFAGNSYYKTFGWRHTTLHNKLESLGVLPVLARNVPHYVSTREVTILLPAYAKTMWCPKDAVISRVGDKFELTFTVAV